MSRAGEIAASLTEAQRRDLRLVKNWPDEGFFVTPIAALNYRTFKALERRQLVLHHIAGMVSCALLTALGLAVRRELERTNTP